MHSLTANMAGGGEATLKRSSDTRENVVSSVLLTVFLSIKMLQKVYCNYKM